MAVFHRERRGFTYDDAAATSTGSWSIVTDRLEETSEFAMKYPNLPPLYLPRDGVILKENFDITPWFYKILLQDDCQTLIQTATWIEDDPGYKYRRVPNKPG